MAVHPYAELALTDALAVLTGNLAIGGRAYHPIVEKAKIVQDEGTVTFVAEVTSKIAFFLIDMATQYAVEGMVFEGLPEWSRAYLSSHGYGWNDDQKYCYNEMMHEYRRTLEQHIPSGNPFSEPIAIFGDDDFKEFFRHAADEDRDPGPDVQESGGTDEEAEGGDGLPGAPRD